MTTLQAACLSAGTGHHRHLPLPGTGPAQQRQGAYLWSGPPSQPKKCHLQMGRRGKSEKTGRRKVNRHMIGILGGRVTAWGEKIGLSHGSGRKHRGPGPGSLEDRAGLGGICPVCCGFRGSRLLGGGAELRENRREDVHGARPRSLPAQPSHWSRQASVWGQQRPVSVGEGHSGQE